MIRIALASALLVHGVMRQGRWLSRADIDRMLERFGRD